MDAAIVEVGLVETMRALASAQLSLASFKGLLVKNESKRGDVMTEQNAHQVADWNGQSGESWVANQARLDAMMAVFGEAAIEAAAPATGERVLDVGCGAGASSLALAARVGAGGYVLGVDISEPLIDRARALAPQDTSALFRVADASNAVLPEGAFDLLFSRFGVMFFDDPTGAFTHMRHALRPGGRVAFVCWRGVGENDWVRLPMGAIKDIVPLPAPPGLEAPGPFSFGDRGRVTRILTAAGFTDIAIEPFDASISFGEGETRDAAIDDAVKIALESGPLSLVLADQPDDIRAHAWAAVRTAFADCPGERSVIINGAAWIVMARNPTASSD
ncbi:class I SAM-dependent methyltransferase [Pseudomonas sp. PSB18]|nr:class I SAM-dependent methyltransferase [Pseudomonas sp. PSB18]